MLNSCPFLCYIPFMFYLYRHIRVDKQEPFYIGKGTMQATGNPYTRAYRTLNRTPHWKSIADKGYEVEIMMEFDNEEECLAKEKEFISLYGRRDLNTGTLVNYTDGGDGLSNLSEESRLKMRLSQKKRFENGTSWNKGIAHTEETKRKLSEALKGRPSPRKGKSKRPKPEPKERIYTAEDRARISENLRNRPVSSKTREKMKETHKTLALSGTHNTARKVINTVTGVIYPSQKEAALREGISVYTLRGYFLGKYKNKTPLEMLPVEKEKAAP